MASRRKPPRGPRWVEAVVAVCTSLERVITAATAPVTAIAAFVAAVLGLVHFF